MVLDFDYNEMLELPWFFFPFSLHTEEVQEPATLEMLLFLLLPWAGSLAQKTNYWLQVQGPVTVEEGLCVQVPCTAFYPQHSFNDSIPTYGYWFRDRANAYVDDPVATNNPYRRVQQETQGRFHLRGDPQIYDCSLEIEKAQKGDTGIYYFRVERGPLVRFSFKGSELYVRVTALTQTPTIDIQGILESGHPRNITCAVPWACKTGMPPTFSWIGAALTTLDPKTSHSSVLTLTPEPHHHGTMLTCRVTLPGTVPEVLGNATSLHVAEGQSLRLVCDANSSPNAKLSWFRGSLALSPPQRWNPGVLEFPHVVSGDRGEFTCQVQHLSHSYRVSLYLVVQEQRGSWPLILTLLRGAIMGAGFLSTYILTWIYYTRTRPPEPKAPKKPICPVSRPSSQGPEPKNTEEELHYAAVNFPALRPWGTQEPKDANTDPGPILPNANVATLRASEKLHRQQRSQNNRDEQRKHPSQSDLRYVPGVGGSRTNHR
ncbi:PREDICTED: sialic acid-binding Ig-like lectin 14-like [Chrysochloris asiatica]|uniref:Sialic acid-binding Ig-like lectin 14-like n=1 Tax=Chrysochloris asiatica TaxID=185453 RepID=A0A9B0TWT2_CHRAS|nr:PREDICTED: sialic acid-binding Ig-like lectin 14-like [Chrysochloris asiatica]